MTKRLTRISPWQSAKTLAVIYFGMGVIFGIPFGLIMSLIPTVPGETRPSAAFFFLFPVFYALMALIFVPLGCWMYNVAARLVGGIEVTVESSPDA